MPTNELEWNHLRRPPDEPTEPELPMPTDRLEAYLRNFSMAAQIEDDGKRMGRCNAVLVQFLREIEYKEIADAYTAAAYRVVMDAPKEYPQ